MNYLIVGLGNIGAEYELTRHNIGFLSVDQFAEKNKVVFEVDRLAYKADFKHKGKTIHLIKPTTYMNLSGKAVGFWIKELKIPLENLLVITDDLNLPFGKMRMRSKGSSGGQNGLNNINEVLQTENYARLRMGIGNEFSKGRQIDYVLGRFSKEQFDELPFLMGNASDAMLSFCMEGIAIAMNKYNS
ncbi:MAG: aminoacyl-tRNA hydrolase [Cytophagales bacterium]